MSCFKLKSIKEINDYGKLHEGSCIKSYYNI